MRKRMGISLIHSYKVLLLCNLYVLETKWGKYGAWKKEMMKPTIMSCRHCNMGINAASRLYDVPKTRIYGGYINAINHGQTFQRSTGLSKEMEDKPAKHTVFLEEMFLGLTRKHEVPGISSGGNLQSSSSF
jgi:hypothetical protein